MPPTSDVIPYAAVLIASLGCFRFWEFWSLGGLEDFYNLLRNSETPNLPVAKAIIKVILIYIPVRSAGGGLHTKNVGLWGK